MLQEAVRVVTPVSVHGDGCNSNRVADLLPIDLAQVLEIDALNNMQQKVFGQAFNTDENLIIAAPTGSGKTLLMEVAILRLVSQRRNSLNTIRVVYIAPSKALCQQSSMAWKRKLEKLGLLVLEVTGDVELKDSLQMIARANVIITTPEKWDSLTRMWRDNVFLLGAMDLLLLDEIHHLGEDRGPTLEVVVVRMRIISRICAEKSARYRSQNASPYFHSRLRIVGLSATLPNLDDLGEWLNCSPQFVHFFDNTFRPVPLQTVTLVCGNAGNPFLFDRTLDNQVKDVILRYGNGKQTLVFCSSKNNAQSLTIKLRDQHAIRTAIHLRPDIARIVQLVQDDALRDVIASGYGYHHAGLPPDDRTIVEELFLKGYIRILCSTSTLAHGVNLPAHLVVVKGTHCWRGSLKGYERLSKSDVIQMLGRAGRPGFDSCGTAVIMTSSEDRDYYSNLSLGADVVDSKLMSMLHEAIVAEVSQTVIQSMHDCTSWFQSTFLFTRMKKNFQQSHRLNQDKELDATVANICQRTIEELKMAGIIDNADDGSISRRSETTIMARHLTKFKSMKILLNLHGIIDLSKLTVAISLCEEMHRPLRRSEKSVLNDWMSKIRFPLKARVQQASQKCYVLLLSAVDRINIKDFSLRIEQAEMVENALRLLRCLQELSIQKREGCVLHGSILLERALRTRLWETGSDVFLQCTGITNEIREALKHHQLNSTLHIMGSSPQQLCDILHCNLQESRALLHFAQELNTNRLTASHLVSPDKKHLTVTVHRDSTVARKSISVPLSLVFRLVVFNTVSGLLLCHRTIDSSNFLVKSPSAEFDCTFDLQLTENIDEDQIGVSLLSSVVGIDFSYNATGHRQLSSAILPTSKKKKQENAESQSKDKLTVQLTSNIKSARQLRNPFESFAIGDSQLQSKTSSLLVSNPESPSKRNSSIDEEDTFSVSTHEQVRRKTAPSSEFVKISSSQVHRISSLPSITVASLLPIGPDPAVLVTEHVPGSATKRFFDDFSNSDNNEGAIGIRNTLPTSLFDSSEPPQNPDRDMCSVEFSTAFL